MASLMEIRSAMMEDLRNRGYDWNAIDQFARRFNENLRYQTDSLYVTTDVEFEDGYAWVDEVSHAYTTCIRIGSYTVKRRYRK